MMSHQPLNNLCYIRNSVKKSFRFLLLIVILTDLFGDSTYKGCFYIRSVVTKMVYIIIGKNKLRSF